MAKQLLKDISVRNAKPASKDLRLNDGSGLYLLVKTSGAKWWRFDYSVDGRRKTISLGVYPSTGLADARRKADEARVLVASGVDPSDNRKADKTARKDAIEQEMRLDAGLPLINSFEYVTRDWLASNAHTVRDITHQKKLRRFELYVFPAIGQMPIGEVKSPDVFAIVRPLIIKNQLETAHRLRSDISGAFAYAHRPRLHRLRPGASRRCPDTRAKSHP
jgi:hypothetical protein